MFDWALNKPLNNKTLIFINIYKRFPEKTPIDISFFRKSKGYNKEHSWYFILFISPDTYSFIYFNL